MQNVNGSQPPTEGEPPEVCCYNVYLVDGTVYPAFSDEAPDVLEARLNKEVSLATKGVFRFIRIPKNQEAVGVVHWARCSQTSRGLEVIELMDEESALEERDALKKEQAAAIAAGKQLYQAIEIRELEVKDTILRTDLIAKLEAAPFVGDDEDEDEEDESETPAVPAPDLRKKVSRLPAGFTPVVH